MKEGTHRQQLANCIVAIACLAASSVAAQEADRLLELVNEYRAAAESCNGKPTRPVPPLASDPVLSKVQPESGAELNDALKKARYQAARAEAIVVSGIAAPDAVMTVLRQQYCRAMLNPDYAAAAIARNGSTWRIVLAAPLLAPGLGKWEQAGREVLKLVNAARAKQRTCGSQRFAAAPPLAWNDKLAAAAHAHSRDMAQQNYFRHEGSDGSGAAERAARAGYKWHRIGENIAAGQGSAALAVSGWLASPGHCANIMNRDFREMGAAYVTNTDSDGHIYWTQVFGTAR